VARIERFIHAQDLNREFEEALAELKAGRKEGHWIWYVFPQIAGLGASRMSQLYAIRDRAEAEAYLGHPVLYSRLSDITEVVADHVRKGVRVDALMNSPIDAQKLVSSLTLFGRVARDLRASGADESYGTFASMADDILAAAERNGYPRCRHTDAMLDR
jgi:uncharacterized protein (DUF1810 family)